MMKRIVGNSMIAAPFVGLFIGMGVTMGWWQAILLFGACAFVTGWIWLGSELAS